MTTKIGDFFVEVYERYKASVNAVYQDLTDETLEESFGGDDSDD